MASPNEPSTNAVGVNKRDIVRVKDQTGEYIAPNMAQDAHVIITRPELVPQGLRLGDWSQVTK